MNVGQVIAACADNPGIRALIVFEQEDRCRTATAATRRSLDQCAGTRGYKEWALLTWTPGYRGWASFTSENGSSLVFARPDVVRRRFCGTHYQLIVADGCSAEDRAYLASRVRSAAAGPPVLGFHTFEQ